MVVTPPSAQLTLEGAREALELYVRATRWLRRDLAKKLDIKSFVGSGSFHVVFRSFTESRSQGPNQTPYFGGVVDGPENGATKAPWDMVVPLPGTFIDEDHIETVPHTDVVRTCHGCQGMGRVTCTNCGGDGKLRCSTCGGDGRENKTRTVTRTNAQGQTESTTEHYTETCSRCSGSGRVTCSTCGGDGQITCPTCNGARQLKHFLELRVSYRTSVYDNIIEKTDLPNDLIAGATGVVIHAEEEDRLEPATAAVQDGPYRGGGRVNAEVNEAINRLIVSHPTPRGQKLHRQSLMVRSVPVYEAHYTWGKETRRFWVYGTDLQILAPKYPISLVRVGFAVGVPTTLVGTAALVGLAGASEPPPRPLIAMTSTPPPPPSPPPPIPMVTVPPPLPKMLVATAKMPVAPKGKAVIEIRTDPPGAEVTVAGKKINGTTPMFLTVPSGTVGVCTFGKCNVGECVSGKKCEPVTAATLRSPDGKIVHVTLKPSLGQVAEFRF